VVLDDGADLVLQRLMHHGGKNRRETILHLIREVDLSIIRSLLNNEEGRARYLVLPERVIR